MQLYNTLTGKKEVLEAPKSGALKLFVCGPTVYDYIQIGNGRTFVNYDIVARYLRSKGIKVYYLQNITDIDDKIIKRAAESGVSPAELAKKYERFYHDDEKALGIDSVTKYARATRYIKEIVRQVQTLIAKGHAYKIEGDGWYFDIATCPEYGKLSKRTAAQAEDAVSRIDESAGKRNRGDFALWKFSKPGEPVWKTELGEGRPGWHIEDTAITETVFGPQYDIHGGGMDLIFPHHEAEIAQQESASGKKPMVRHWLHSGFLNIGGEKMSKSRGGFVTVRDFLKEHSPEIFRWLAASHHYRSPLNYSDELISQSKNTLSGIGQFLAKAAKAAGMVRVDGLLEKAETAFGLAMDDDLNTPGALAAIFGLINELQPKVWQLDKKFAKTVKKWLENKLEIFGIRLKDPKIPATVASMAKKRELFRTSKQFAQSDDLRKQAEALGYTIEDTPHGPFIWPVK